MPPEILPANTTENPDIQTLLQYWQQLRAGNGLPSKPSDLKNIGPLLKYVHFSDVLDHGEAFRFRVLGDAVFQGLQEKQAGRLVSEHPDMGVRLRFPILMREVVQTQKPVRGLATRVTDVGHFRAEFIWLPFGKDIVTQIMGMGILTSIT